MSKLFSYTLLVVFSISQIVFAADMGIPVQLKLKSPSGTYPTESGVTFRVMVLSYSTGCILREENFTSQNVANGSISLILGKGTLGSNDPGLSLNQVYDNTKAKTGLTCVDVNNNITLTGQSYTPAPTDHRVIRIQTTLSSDLIIVDFDQRSVPFAVQAESVGGKLGADILVQNTTTQLNQINLNDLLLDVTRFNNLKNYAMTGVAPMASNFSGALVGDVSGGQGTTSVDKIKGIAVSATAPTSGQVLQFNGTQYVPTSIATSSVVSVAGRTGAVVLTSSDISGLGSAASQNVGTAAGNVVQLDAGAKIPVSTLPASVLTTSSATATDVAAATSANTPSTIVKRDGAGNFSAGTVLSQNNSTNNVYIYDTTNYVRVKAASGLGSNLTLTLPSSNGSSGQVLQTDGSGNLSWVTASSGSVNSVTASVPITSSGGANPNLSIAQANTTTNGYLSSVDWNTFNNKQNSLGYVPLSPSTNFVGDVTGNASATVVASVGGKSSAQVATSVNDTIAATNLNTASAIVKRDAAGSVSLSNVILPSGANSITVKSPAGLSTSYNFILPNGTGTSGQYLQTDGSGNLSWVTGATSGVSAVTASSPLSSSGGTNPNITIAVGTTAGTVAAGDDARITGALQASAYNTQVAPAALCTTSQTPYYNSISNAWACQNINFPTSVTLAGDVSGDSASNVVDTVGGKAAASIASTVDDVAAGTSSNGSNTLVRRDVSGNVSITSLSSTSASSNDFYFFSGANAVHMKAPAGLGSNLNLVLPNSNGAAGQVLKTDGAGNLSWVTPSSGSVTSVAASAPLSSTGGAAPTISISQANGTTNGYLSSADWTTFNSKQNALGFTPLNAASNLSDVANAATARTNLGLGTAAVLNVGTAANNIPQLDVGAKIPVSTLPTSVITTSTSLVGDVTGNVSATVVSNVGGKTSAQVATSVNDTLAATNANTVSTIVKRDASGNVSLTSTNLVSGANAITVKAPAALGSNLNFILPNSNGSAGQVLQTDGAGNLSWLTAATGTVTTVTASAPLSSSGGAAPNITLSQANTTTNGFLSSTDWNTFNNKQAALGFTPLNKASNLSDLASVTTARTNLGLGGAAVLNVGTATGTVAAGDDSRITGALQTANYNAQVAPAALCSNTQTSYYNSVSSAWACQNISFPAAPVTSVAGRTGAVVLVSSDITGLGTAAVLNVGVAANNIPQLDAAAKIPASTLPNSVINTSTALVGDVTGTVSATVVSNVGGKTSAQVATSVNDTLAATNANTASTIVKRDASGNVSLTSTNLVSGANAITVKAPAGLGANLNFILPNANGSAGQVLQTDGVGNLSWITVQASLGFTPLNKASNLSDLASVVTARTNLGLGGAAVLNVGTVAGTVAAGDDSRITGALQTSNYNAQVAPAALCSNTQTSYYNSVSSAWACQNISFPVTTVAGRAGAVTLVSSDISGLGTAAVLNVGTAANNIPQLDAGGRIPASELPTNALTTATVHAGDVSGAYNTLSVDRIKGTPVSATAPTAGQVLVYNGTQWVPATGMPQYAKITTDLPAFTATAVVSATGLAFPVTGGNVYKYKFHVLYTSAATTTGLRLGLIFPAVNTASALANIASGADGTGAYFQGVINFSGDSVQALNTPSSTTIQNAIVEGIIYPSANGTVQLTAATEIAGSNIVIKAGSMVEYTQLP